MVRVAENSSTQSGASRSQRIVVREAPHNAETPLEALSAELTPTERHYVRSNFAEPSLSDDHEIRLEGAVHQPGVISVGTLRGAAARTLTVTMECAGNNRLGLAPLPPGEPWDFGAISTATWTGARLKDLLLGAGLRDDVVEVLVVGADRGKVEGSSSEVPFARALPREVALDEDTLLAWEMNGSPLTHRHGAPVRLIVPGWYGMASVKWVCRIEALTAPFSGHFQTERYVYEGRDGARAPVTRMKVKSLVTEPGENATVPAGRVQIGGWAWSGEGGIERVEVSVDGGPWTPAELGPQRSRHAWRRFCLEVHLTRKGRHTVRSRATDAAGRSQPEHPEWNSLGYGNNAITVRKFDVR